MADLIKKKINGVCWEISKNIPGYESIDKNDLYCKLDALFKYVSASGTERAKSHDLINFTLLKTGRRKIFGMMNLFDKDGKPDVYAKVFKDLSLSVKARHLFNDSKTKQEFILACEIADRGIPTAVQVAIGEKRRMGLLETSIIIVKSIENSVNLLDFFSDSKTLPNERHAVIEEFGKTARLSHDRGVLQEDFALNNFLAQRLPDKNFRVYLIDFERAGLCGSVSNDDRFWLLSKLNRAGFDFSISDKTRFLKAYLKGGPTQAGLPESKSELIKWMQSLDWETIKLLRKGAIRVWNSCVKNERKYRRHECQDFEGYYLSKHNPDILTGKINRLDSTDSQNDTENENEIRIIEYSSSGSAGSSLACWQNINALSKARINTAEPIAVFAKKDEHGNAFRPGGDNCYLIMSPATDAKDIKDIFAGIKEDEKRISFIYKLAGFICRLHIMGTFERDLAAGDLLANNFSGKYAIIFNGFNNFCVNVNASHNQRQSDVEKVINYFGSTISDVEKIKFNEFYAVNEVWYFER